MKKLISFLLSALTIVSMIFYSLPVSAASVENPYSQFIDDPYYKVTSNYLNEIVDKLSNLKSSGNTSSGYNKKSSCYPQQLLSQYITNFCKLCPIL